MEISKLTFVVAEYFLPTVQLLCNVPAEVNRLSNQILVTTYERE